MFDFDEVVDRRNTNSLKWDVGENELPLWVGDMDFKTAPAVSEALAEKARFGVFGYNVVPDGWYSAIIGWWKRRYSFEIRREWLCFCTGVVAAITSAVKRITNVGDSVAVITPNYNIFYHSVENTGRHVLECPFKYDGKKYALDYRELEKVLAQPLTTMMIFCNPHNPVGKIWTAEELARIGSLCKKHGVTVLSDEIHCDITEPNAAYVPFASASEECAEISVTALSPGKSFNLAGLHTAAVFVPEPRLREKIVRGLNSDEVAEPNSFAVDAVIAAYGKGEEWFEELRAYLWGNRKTAVSFFKTMPEVHPVSQKATYFLWVDCSGVTSDAEELCGYIRQHTGLFISAGNQFRGNGKTFVRINLGCPKDRLLKGLQLFKEGVYKYLNK